MSNKRTVHQFNWNECSINILFSSNAISKIVGINFNFTLNHIKNRNSTNFQNFA